MKIYPKRSYKENGKNSEENFAKKNHDLTGRIKKTEKIFFYKFIINYVVYLTIKQFQKKLIFVKIYPKRSYKENGKNLKKILQKKIMI